MRFRLVLFFLGLLFLTSISSCRSGKKETKVTAVERRDSCRSNPAHSYEIFVPAHKEGQRMPLLLAIDPHGSGHTALEHLKNAVSKYPSILVSSNLIRNNDPRFVKELDELIEDVRSRYPAGNHIYLAGFSGGARMALSYAMNHQADGVIAAGAFARPDQLAAISCPVVGIVGMEDFNFPEIAPFILDPTRLPSRVHIELMEASHEWPDEEMMKSTYGWFRLQDEKNDDRQSIRQYAEEQKARMDSLADSGNILQAASAGRTMAAVGQFEKFGSFRTVLDNLTSSKEYQQQLSGLVQSLKYEMKMREVYGPALLEKDKSWWEKEISTLHKKMNSEPDKMMRMAYKRLNGFIGIACYSYASQFAARNDIPRLKQILMVYRIAEPDNPDLHRFEEGLR